MDIRKNNIEGNNNIVIQGDNNNISLWTIVSSDSTPHNVNNEKNVRLLMQHMNVYLMDDYFQREPQRVNTKIIVIHDLWNAIINSSTYCIYNQELDSAIRDFFDIWSDIISRGYVYYSPSNTPTDYVFGGGKAEFDLFNNHDEECFFKEMLHKWKLIYDKYKIMIQCIKQHYVIDFNDIVKELTVLNKNLHFP